MRHLTPLLLTLALLSCDDGKAQESPNNLNTNNTNNGNNVNNGNNTGLPQNLCRTVSYTSYAPTREEVRSTRTCSGCNEEGVATIRFVFQNPVKCGTFVDGSPWVADNGDGVVVTSIFPQVTNDCGAQVCNGWMINPASSGQAFDGRRQLDETLLPDLLNPSVEHPLTLYPNESLLKSVSLQDEVSGSDCSQESVFGVGTRNCLYFYGVLTVLDQAPPDSTGEGYYRPPYVAGEKPLIPISQADLSMLPSLPTGELEHLPDLAVAERTLCTPVVDFMGTYRAQFFKGYLNTGECPSAYQGSVSRRMGDYLLRTLHGDRTPRALHCVVQRGIDLYHMLAGPVAVRWGPNGGHGQGRTVWPYLAGVLLGRDDWLVNMDSMEPGRFAERSQVYFSPVADPEGLWGEGPGEVLYGGYPGRGGPGQCTAAYYWENCYTQEWPGSDCNRICADPFGYIDGGEPGVSYQAIFGPAAKSSALAAFLIPTLQERWPLDDGHKLFLDYMERWVAFGAWTSPDPCASSTAQPAPESPEGCSELAPGSCMCTPGEGRYTDRHGTGADSGHYNSPYTGELWSLFKECAADCSCPGMEQLCP